MTRGSKNRPAAAAATTIAVAALLGGCAGSQKRKPAKKPAASKTATTASSQPAQIPASGPRARGKSFSVPVPVGFSWLREPTGEAIDAQLDKVTSAGGILLIANERPPVPKGFLASIVTLPAPGGGAVNRKPALCKRLAAVMARRAGTRLDSAGLRPVQGRDTCQWVVRPDEGDEKPEHRSRGAVIVDESGKDVWVLTCTYDRRDEVARSACDLVVEGWSFEPPQGK